MLPRGAVSPWKSTRVSWIYAGLLSIGLTPEERRNVEQLLFGGVAANSVVGVEPGELGLDVRFR
jgi:hypothetical protein